MDIYPLRIDYSVPLPVALHSARLTDIDPSITARAFPLPTRREQLRRLQIHYLERSSTALDVEAELAKHRQDLANLWDLLALIHRFELPPGLIVALGSRWFYPIGGNYSPFVHLGAGFRELRIVRTNRSFGPQCGFLAALKETS